MDILFKKAKSLSLLLSVFVMILTFQNCSQPYNVAPVTPATADPNAAAAAPSSPVACTPQTSVGNVRIMFIVDSSGSTLTTDPNAVLRTEATNSFINANLQASNLSYSYSYFANAGGSYDFSKSSFVAYDSAYTTNVVQPFASASRELEATAAFTKGFNSKVIPSSGTNYQLAFQVVQSLILSDVVTNPGYNYVVIFMSDGQPTSGGSSYSTYVKNVVDAAGGSKHATVSGVYFGPESDTNSIANIKNIAQYGGGEFADASNTKLTLDNMIQNLIKVPTGACL